jgi:hypothetical protein
MVRTCFRRRNHAAAYNCSRPDRGYRDGDFRVGAPADPAPGDIGAATTPTTGELAGAAILPADIHFPTQQPTGDVMEALLIGGLVLENGCLRINTDEGGVSYLAVWPNGFTAQRTEDGTIEVLDPPGQIVAASGQRVRVSGGEFASEDMAAFDQMYPGARSEACPGPYWIVGSEVSAVE